MPGQLLTVVPDSDRVEAWLLAEARRRPFVDARAVCTLAQLVERCEPARWAGRAPAGPVLLQVAVASLAPAHLLGAFGPAAQDPAFARQALELLAHLRAQAASPALLRRAALASQGASAARATALAGLWEALDATLEAEGLVDPGQLTLLAARRLRTEGLPPALQGWAQLRVQDVTDLFPARLDFLEALAEACHGAGVGLELRWPASGEPAADLFVLDAVRQIEARWQALDVEAAPRPPEGPLAWVGAAAFADAPVPAPAEGLGAFSAASPREEARQLAARVKALVVAGTPPERIAIAFRDLADDTEALLEALGELGVPARARLGLPLLASAPGRLALSVLELVEDDVPAEGLATVLESGLVDCVLPAAAPVRATFLEAGVRSERWGAVEGQGGYAVRLAALARRTRQPAARAGVEALAASVEQALQAVLGIPAEGPALELLEAWWEALSRLGLFRRLATRPQPALDAALGWGEVLDRSRARDQAAGEALLALLGSLKEALVRTGLARRPTTRAGLSRLARAVAADVNLEARGPRAGAVWLLDARELPGRELDVLFLGGLVDGRFPGRAAPLPLFSEEERAALNQAVRTPLFRLGVAEGGARLPVRLAEDRLLLALALGAAPRVTLSRARLDAGGREALPSPFLDALGRAVEGFAEEAVPREPVPPLAQAWSEAELQARLALEAFCPPSTRQARGEGLLAGALEAAAPEPWVAHARALSAMETERLGFFSDPARAAGPASGQLPVALAEAVDQALRFDAGRPVSASTLGDFAGCGFRGLARHLLGLDAPAAAGEEADERTQGTFLHAVLAELVPELDRRGQLGTEATGPGALEAAVRAAVDTVADRLGPTQATGHPALWALTRERTAREVLRVVGEAPLARPFGPARVAGVELRFGRQPAGLPGLEAVRLPAAFPGERDVYLQGSLDRLDVGAGVVGVLDYKSGKGSPSRAREELLTSDFQLPLYLLAARAAFPDRPVDAAWLQVRGREVRRLSEVLARLEASVQDLLATGAEERRALVDRPQANLANAVHGLLGRLRGGDFGARPRDCGFCEWKRVCRITSRRLAEGA